MNNKDCNKERQFICQYGCGKGYLTNVAKLRHERTCSIVTPIGRGITNQFYKQDRQQHGKDIYKVKSAHGGTYVLYRKDLYIKKDFNETVHRVLTGEFKTLITAEDKNIKFYITLNAIFHKGFNNNVYTDPPI